MNRDDLNSKIIHCPKYLCRKIQIARWWLYSLISFQNMLESTDCKSGREREVDIQCKCDNAPIHLLHTELPEDKMTGKSSIFLGAGHGILCWNPIYCTLTLIQGFSYVRKGRISVTVGTFIEIRQWPFCSIKFNRLIHYHLILSENLSSLLSYFAK